MSEDIRVFVAGARYWKLSANDDRLLARLSEVVRQWLRVTAKPKDVIAFGYILQALEGLIENGTPTGSGESEFNSKRKGDGGTGAHFTLSPNRLAFDLTEYVWIGAQVFDHGSILDEEGRPFHLEFTPEGSFDEAKFDIWQRYSDNGCDGTPGSDVIAHASWYSEARDG